MRITNSMLFDTLVAQLQRINQEYARYSEQIATGKRINRPSDDPQGASELLALRQEMVTLTKFNDNVIEAQRRLEMTDARLNDYTNSLTRVVQLVTQAASTPTVGGPRTGIALEIRSIQEQLLSLADSQMADRYLFAGTRTTLYSIQAAIPTVPDPRVYTIADDLEVSGNGITSGTVTNRDQITGDIYIIRFTDASGSYEIFNLDENEVVATGTAAAGGGTITFDGLEISYATYPGQDEEWVIQPQYQYNGTDDRIELQVDENTNVIQNVTGPEAFGGSSAAPGGTIFDDLVDLRYALLTDDQAAIEGAIDTFNANWLDDTGQLRARVGGRISNLRVYEEQSRTRVADLLIKQAEVENVDLAEAITKLTQTEGSLQAALQVTARVGGLNLLNFMR